ncbi:FdtA/QdtA family cupin domain-containing protein [Devosia sp. BK]|uniref:sugar 3,4-ketoisomerase n=1 Tax=Devosia sp. BK TaxID=2871706 RepID=UPI00293986E2|nr:FdtA/QdtA family cupin domain-containing protein [Devosia sp. BK]MDV3253795.1 FdtA/QdtA family cupin domain-containing protein [Devosia sp. BK]
MAGFELISFPLYEAESGTLSVYEQGAGLRFDVKRVYCITQLNPGSTRGHHAHRELQQIVVCLSGSCVFTLDDGTERVDIPLSSPSTGLYLSGRIWREMSEFTSNCVLMVMTDAVYSEADYIRDYETFLEEVKN